MGRNKYENLASERKLEKEQLEREGEALLTRDEGVDGDSSNPSAPLTADEIFDKRNQAEKKKRKAQVLKDLKDEGGGQEEWFTFAAERTDPHSSKVGPKFSDRQYITARTTTVDFDKSIGQSETVSSQQIVEASQTNPREKGHKKDDAMIKKSGIGWECKVSWFLLLLF